MQKNENCSISDSILCKWINKDCKKCFVVIMRKEDQAVKLLDDFKVTLSMLPEDFDELQGDCCQFCKGEKGRRFGYIIADMAHTEPKSITGMFFGFGKKIRRKVGSYLVTSISICRSCRKTMLLTELLRWIPAIVAFGIAATFVSLPSTGSSLDELTTLGILALSILAGYIAGALISRLYADRKKKNTRFDVFEIPICAKMKETGWFTMQDGTRYIFSKKPQTRRIIDISETKVRAEEPLQTSFFND